LPLQRAIGMLDCRVFAAAHCAPKPLPHQNDLRGVPLTARGRSDTTRNAISRAVEIGLLEKGERCSFCALSLPTF
jgi:hypothetical protein